MPSKPKKVDVGTEIAAAVKALAPAVKRITAMAKTLKPEDVPPGALADMLYDLRVVGKQLNNLQAPFDDVLQPCIKMLEEHFINSLAVGESSGVQGHEARVQITDSPRAVVQDWEKFYAHIAKTKQFELLNRAVNQASVQERWDAKKQVPGVGVFIVKKVSCTKLGGKK